MMFKVFFLTFNSHMAYSKVSSLELILSFTVKERRYIKAKPPHFPTFMLTFKTEYLSQLNSLPSNQMLS